MKAMRETDRDHGESSKLEELLTNVEFSKFQTLRTERRPTE
jgi:hypothetical protein